MTLATTRPETMLGDTAVAVHPEPAAALDKAEAELKARLEAAGPRRSRTSRSRSTICRSAAARCCGELETLARMARDGRKVRLPLLEPRDAAGGRRLGQARTGHGLREDHAGPRPQRL